MQIPNGSVYKMIERLEYIAHHPGLDERGRHYAESIIEYLQTNFKSKPNYVRDKASLSLHGALSTTTTLKSMRGTQKPLGKLCQIRHIWLRSLPSKASSCS